MQTIGGQTLRIRDMIGDVMLFARAPEPQRKPFAVAAALSKIVDTLRSRAERSLVQLEWSPPSDADRLPLLNADPSQFATAVSGLLLNAFEHSPAGERVQLQLEHHPATSATDPEHLAILVTDHGDGLSAHEREHLFDPFFSGRSAGRGLGFGLCKAWRIVHNHGGHITSDESHPLGLKIRLIWPIIPITPPTT